jgi:hypothetical protein
MLERLQPVNGQSYTEASRALDGRDGKILWLSWSTH